MPSIAVRIVHAYNPRNGLNGDGRVGSEHYAVINALDVGRLHRRPGDPLCRPARKFSDLWPWDSHNSYPPTICRRCQMIADRLSITVVPKPHP